MSDVKVSFDSGTLKFEGMPEDFTAFLKEFKAVAGKLIRSNEPADFGFPQSESDAQQDLKPAEGDTAYDASLKLGNMA